MIILFPKIKVFRRRLKPYGVSQGIQQRGFCRTIFPPLVKPGSAIYAEAQQSLIKLPYTEISLDTLGNFFLVTKVKVCCNTKQEQMALGSIQLDRHLLLKRNPQLNSEQGSFYFYRTSTQTRKESRTTVGVIG